MPTNNARALDMHRKLTGLPMFLQGFDIAAHSFSKRPQRQFGLLAESIQNLLRHQFRHHAPGSVFSTGLLEAGATAEARFFCSSASASLSLFIHVLTAQSISNFVRCSVYEDS